MAQVDGATDIRDRLRTTLSALTLWLGVVWVGASLPTVAAAKPAEEAQGAELAPEAVVQVATWVAASGDNKGLPFMIIDKFTAEVFVFGPDGRFRGVTPALLGVARGDHSAPGVGDRELSDIPPKDRTTPAGRFVANYGPAYGGQTVLWVDYETSVSLHPVVTTNPKEHRLERLASATPDDNRITFGCINVAAAFYDEVVRPTFTGTSGVVYILPEATPLNEVFPQLRAQSGEVVGRLP